MAERGKLAPEARRPQQLVVTGFKSIRDQQRVSLHPLTLLCGSNSSGKSAFMQPLLLLKQSLEVGFDAGPLLLHGPHVSFDRAAEMFWSGRTRTDRVDEFSIGVRDFDDEEAHVVFGLENHGVSIRRVENRYTPKGKSRSRRVQIKPDMTQAEIRSAADSEFMRIFAPLAKSAKLAVRRDRSFLDLVLVPDDERLRLDDFVFNMPSPSASILRSLASQILHLPGLRDSPSRQYPVTQHGSQFPGPFHVYTASLIANWIQTRDERWTRVNEDMKALGLTWKVVAERVDDTKVRVRVGRLPKAQHGGANDLVSLADVGLGVSQTLPIVVALHAARPGQLVYLEQPELHLHPRAQTVLGKILLDATRRHVRVICETHSHLVLRSIQTEVARDPRLQSQVSLNWFTRDKDGASQISTALLDSKGRFGDWPVDFGDVELDSEAAFLRASLGGD